MGEIFAESTVELPLIRAIKKKDFICKKFKKDQTISGCELTKKIKSQYPDTKLTIGNGKFESSRAHMLGGHIFEDALEGTYNLSSVGVDIGSEEFTGDYVYQTLKKFPLKVLKPFLLDQKYFAGCGNYIASEICARAGIRPTRRCGKVTRKDAEKIADVTKIVLDQSLASNGMTFSGGYSDTSGDIGEGVKNLVVFYQDLCGLCGKTPVKKIVLQTRGTYYCPKCQK